MQNIIVTANSIGPHINENIAKPGDVMYHCYKENDCPPEDKYNMPKYDTFGPEKYHDIPIKELKIIMSSKGIDISGSINNLRK